MCVFRSHRRQKVGGTQGLTEIATIRFRTHEAHTAERRGILPAWKKELNGARSSTCCTEAGWSFPVASLEKLREIQRLDRLSVVPERADSQ